MALIFDQKTIATPGRLGGAAGPGSLIRAL